MPKSAADLRRLALLFSALVIAVVAVRYLLAATGLTSSNGEMGSAPKAGFHYEAVSGVFMQDDPATDPATFDYSKHNFGLIDRSYDTDAAEDGDLSQWQRFERYVQLLIRSSTRGTLYKVIYMGRHGEGYHNVAEAFYGTKAWDDYWSKLDGNGTAFWSDAHLTAIGKEQALEAHTFFGEQLAWAKMPAPERYYVSPLFRCLQTANLTFSGLKLPAERPFAPVVKEMMREVMGEHTCDRRSSRTVIRDAFPDWRIEPGFVEEDELWRADHRETYTEHDVRSQALLDELFAHDQSTFVSFTAHSGTIASMLRVTHHREFKLPTGALIPVLIKATRQS
ncbi:hypothetical protein LTR36_007950 [Oleoguttula mirabilis]|uniref:Phosphoglycerate mutase n=1 Tax=Oleoguttula mirabilis TaxID=1507867 RepID=A0AAV9J9V2_9PEZI|nr:hypothetical protein LTR36_007950 [Oleoguttula mirabilis]